MPTYDGIIIICWYEVEIGRQYQGAIQVARGMDGMDFRSFCWIHDHDHREDKQEKAAWMTSNTHGMSILVCQKSVESLYLLIWKGIGTGSSCTFFLTNTPDPSVTDVSYNSYLWCVLMCIVLSMFRVQEGTDMARDGAPKSEIRDSFRRPSAI